MCCFKKKYFIWFLSFNSDIDCMHHIIGFFFRIIYLNWIYFLKKSCIFYRFVTKNLNNFRLFFVCLQIFNIFFLSFFPTNCAIRTEIMQFSSGWETNLSHFKLIGRHFSHSQSHSMAEVHSMDNPFLCFAFLPLFLSHSRSKRLAFRSVRSFFLSLFSWYFRLDLGASLS